MIRAPRVSEKTARHPGEINQYVFEVATTATKADVKLAVESLFNVKVEAVNVLNVKGKSKTFRFARRQSRRLAQSYVRLAEGQSIDVMAKA